nr:integrase, catalytic region, zinc finger, CCHC-type, peptidase aspartic, catalytic [Tanacetum cinerariifolium]
MYAIDVEPIPPRLRNNREFHLDYRKHLKEIVETLREIVEEAKIKRPLDISLASACLYTKHSQELLEYVVQIVIWYLDSGCLKHITVDRSWLRNFMKKFIRTVRFGNDHFGAIMGYGDYVIAGSESRPPMLNKENYVPRSSRLLRYAKSRPNGKLIHNSIINGPYVRRMIPEPGDTNREVPVNETFHVQPDDELTEKELKQIEADDQAIQTILLGLPKDIYTAVDSC